MNPVLGSINPVIENSRHVKTDMGRIRELAPEIANEGLELPKWNFPVYPEGNGIDVIDFFMLFNSINFAFTQFEEPHGKFKVKQMGMDFPWSGSMAMTYCMKRAMSKVMDAKYLASMTLEEGRKLLRGDTIEIPMLKERVAVLNEVGTVLDEKYKGHFHHLVEDSNMHAFKDGNGIVEKLVKDFPSFNDTRTYKGHTVFFYKRAQLAVGMLYARLHGTGLFDIADIDDLTVYADYVLPVSLTTLGIMAKDKKLEDKIQNWVEIEENSEEEVEVRAHTVHGAALLTEAINRYKPESKKVNNVMMDARLWYETRKPPLKQGYKHQLVKTIDY